MRSRHRVAALGAALLLAPFLLAPSPARAATPRILVQALDFYDTSIDQRPFVIADQKRWLADATALLRRRIDAGGAARVVTGAKADRLMAALARDYQHPSQCRSCVLAAARALGARYVFTGAIHKISDLICYMQGELDDARTGTVILTTSTEVKADNRTMWLRAAQALAMAVSGKL